MTIEEVQSLVRLQSAGDMKATNSHRISFEQAMIPARKIRVTWRDVRDGNVTDEHFSVWLVGQENATDGYKIVMRDDGAQFGLASIGFSDDKHLLLVGWYGSLLSAFMAM